MSKAFTKDDDAGPAPLVPHRAPLPAGQKNYVTARGLAALRTELAALRAELSGRGQPDDARRLPLGERLVELEERVASAELVAPSNPAPTEARFGAHVTVRGADGAERRYSIVGVDEADAGQGRIAFVAPLARALLGKRAGDSAVVRTPHGDDELDVLRVEYEPAGDESRTG